MHFPGFTAERTLLPSAHDFQVATLGDLLERPGEVAPANIACNLICNFGCIYSGGDADVCATGCALKCKPIKSVLA